MSFSVALELGPGLMGGDLPAYYVDGTSGNDTTGDGLTLATAWKTIHKALQTVPNSAPCNIWLTAGTYAENSAGLKYLRITRAVTGVTVRPLPGQSVSITDASSGTYSIYCSSSGVTLRDVTLYQTVGNTLSTIYLANGASLACVGCTIDTHNWCMYTTATAAVSISLTNCTFAQRSGAAGDALGSFFYPGAGGTVTVNMVNCSSSTLTSAGANGTLFQFWTSHATGTTIATVHGGTYAGDAGYVFNTRLGSLDLVGVTVSSTTYPAVVYGTDGTGTQGSSGNIANSVISSSASHAVLIGDESSSVAISGGTITGGDHGLVLKECRSNTVDGVTIVGGTNTALYFKAATDCTVTNCTLSNTAGVVMLSGVNPTTGNKAGDNVFTDNVVTATGSADLWTFADATGDTGGSVVDRNTYDISGTTGNVGSVYGTAAITTLVDLQTAWDAYDVVTNDENSTLAT